MEKIKNGLRWGTGSQTLVFLHYFGGSANSWRWVAEELQQDYNSLALHLPGFGGTPPLENPTIGGMAAYVQQALDELQVENYTLIGHSMGGKIALQVAADAKENAVKQIVLVAPSPPTIEKMPEEEKTRMLHHPDKTEAEKTVTQATVASLTAEQQNLAVATQLFIDQLTWRWWLLEGMDHSIADQLPLQVNITVLASKDDPAITFEMIREDVMPNLEQAELITTNQMGHLLPLECPEWVAQQIRKAVAA